LTPWFFLVYFSTPHKRWLLFVYAIGLGIFLTIVKLRYDTAVQLLSTVAWVATLLITAYAAWKKMPESWLLIIEDENRIAKRLSRMSTDFFGDQLTVLEHRDSVETGRHYLAENQVDLLLLDLNLNGEDGFTILQEMTAEACHVVIVSAYHDRALQAFEYGVLDFVPKPFNAARLFKAFSRLSQRGTDSANGLKYLSVQKKGILRLIPVDQLRYVQGAGVYTQLVLSDGTEELHNKSLDRLSVLLPDTFFRIHKSYLVNLTEIRDIRVEAGGKYTAVLKDGTELPVGRTRYRGVA
jgi:two-component system response regulator LytT